MASPCTTTMDINNDMFLRKEYYLQGTRQLAGATIRLSCHQMSTIQIQATRIVCSWTLRQL